MTSSIPARKLTLPWRLYSCSRAKVAWTPGSGGKSGAVVAIAGYPASRTTRLLARHAREHGPAEGHACLANLAQGTECKIFDQEEVKPYKVRYYLEQRDPDFAEKVAEVRSRSRSTTTRCRTNWRARPDLLAHHGTSQSKSSTAASAARSQNGTIHVNSGFIRGPT